MTLVTALQLIGVLAPVSLIDLADGRLADHAGLVRRALDSRGPSPRPN